MSVRLQLLEDFLKIVRNAIQDPTDKAAAQLALDGIDAWADIATRPSILKLEADIGVYMAARQKAAPASAPVELPDPPSSVQPTDDRSDHSHGSLMNPAL
jgi:hypothetical protein